jgi:hypothetical protein
VLQLLCVCSCLVWIEFYAHDHLRQHGAHQREPLCQQVGEARRQVLGVLLKLCGCGLMRHAAAWFVQLHGVAIMRLQTACC